MVGADPATPPTAQIDTPLPGQQITGPVPVTGTAFSPILDYWVLEARGVDIPVRPWTELARSQNSISSGTLGDFDPTICVLGTAEIRIRAIDWLGREATASVTVDVNVPWPNAEITSPTDSAQISHPIDVIGTADSPILDYYVLEYRSRREVSAAGELDHARHWRRSSA